MKKLAYLSPVDFAALIRNNKKKIGQYRWKSVKMADNTEITK